MGIIDRTKENGLRNNLHMLMNEVTRDGYSTEWEGGINECESEFGHSNSYSHTCLGIFFE